MGASPLPEIGSEKEKILIKWSKSHFFSPDQFQDKFSEIIKINFPNLGFPLEKNPGATLAHRCHIHLIMAASEFRSDPHYN